jgi:hypothetical protein
MYDKKSNIYERSWGDWEILWPKLNFLKIEVHAPWRSGCDVSRALIG